MQYEKVVALCRDLPDPRHSSGELRFWHILCSLRQASRDLLIFTENVVINHDMASFKIYSIDQLDNHVKNTTLVVVEFWHMMLHTGAFRKARIPIILDSVDIEFLRRDRQAETLGACAEYSDVDRLLEMQAYESADCIIAVSEQDRDMISEINKNIAILPNIFEPPEFLPEFENRSGICFVGSFPHFPNVDGMRWYRDNVLPLVCDLPHIIIGISAPDDICAMPGYQGWVNDSSEWVKRARVCIAPLRFGAGLKGKVLEGMACGTPVVTTTIGYEGYDRFDDQESVAVADTAQDIAQWIRHLHEDKETWQRFSNKGRELARKFTPQENYSRLHTIIVDTLDQQTSYQHA